MVTLSEVNDDLKDQIEDGLSSIASGASVTELGASFESTIESFQALAICHLLSDFDVPRFRRHLVYSGYARRGLLRRAASEGVTGDEHLAISRTQAFFNAIAARHDALAAELVALSPKEWMPDGEYEDDYCYTAFMHIVGTSSDSVDRDALEALLERFERALEGGASVRLDLCRALFERSAEGFTAAFAALLADHAAWAKENERFRGWDNVFVMRSRLFVEGVAILAIADRLGYATEPEYPFCPKVARLAPTDEWPEDVFDEIDRIAAEEREGRA